MRSPASSDHRRTVLSHDAVASSRPAASVAARLIGAPCVPVSTRRIGSPLGCACATAKHGLVISTTMTRTLEIRYFADIEDHPDQRAGFETARAGQKHPN